MRGAEIPDSLIDPDEPPAFERCESRQTRPVLLVCDHASRRFPRALGTLGLPDASTYRHIAWDIGAADLTRALAARLECQAVLSGYSRLVIDCNRRLEDPTSIAAESDGEVIPGNLQLTQAERVARARDFFQPYHRVVRSCLDELREGSRVPVLISVHSFTPVMNGFARPWHCGVLWDRDSRIAAPLIEALRAQPSLVVGDNEPYSGRHPAGYTTDAHAQDRGWPHVSLEIRQDLISDPEGVERWADWLAAALGPILAKPMLYRAIPVTHARDSVAEEHS